MTWTEGFGFQHMSEERLAATRSELHVLIFPGMAQSPVPRSEPHMLISPGAIRFELQAAYACLQQLQHAHCLCSTRRWLSND